MVRFGVSVRVLGQGNIPIAAQGMHLSRRLLQLRDTLRYLATRQIHFYRLPTDLFPLDLPPAALAQQLEESHGLLAELGRQAQQQGMRLTMHLGLHHALGSPQERVASQAAAALEAATQLLDALGCGPDGTLVVHVGGAYGDRGAALQRFAERYTRLSHSARQRLAVEHDESSFSLHDLLQLHRYCGVPVVFDSLHHQIHNPERIPLAEALALALESWPAAVRPKCHASSQRTEGHILLDHGVRRVVPPRHGHHADYLNPFEIAQLLAAAGGLRPFDLMLEAKAGDLALLRLRDDLQRYAPEQVLQLGGCA